MLLPHRFLQPLVALFLLCLQPVAQAAPPLNISDAWVAEGPPVASVLAGYLTIENPGSKDISITGASCPDFKAVEIHEMHMANGMMEMKQIEKLLVPAGGRVQLAPGGFHLMLIKPNKIFKAGDTLTVTLTLDTGQSLAVMMPVKKRDASDAHHHH
jgi:copper(I)-binding protein